MKLVFVLMLGVVLCMCTGCGSELSQPSAPAPQQQPVPQQLTPLPPSALDPAVWELIHEGDTIVTYIDVTSPVTKRIEIQMTRSGGMFSLAAIQDGFRQEIGGFSENDVARYGESTIQVPVEGTPVTLGVIRFYNGNYYWKSAGARSHNGNHPTYNLYA